MSDFNPPAAEPKRWRDLAISAKRTDGLPSIDGKNEYEWSFIFAGTNRGILRNRWMELVKEPDEDKWLLSFGYLDTSVYPAVFVHVEDFIGTRDECRSRESELKKKYGLFSRGTTIHIGKEGEWKRVDIDDNEYSKSVDF